MRAHSLSSSACRVRGDGLTAMQGVDMSKDSREGPASSSARARCVRARRFPSPPPPRRRHVPRQQQREEQTDRQRQPLHADRIHDRSGEGRHGDAADAPEHGEGGVAGFAKGGADVKLTEIPEGCKLSYVAEANVGGKIAQLGARLLDGVAKKLADQFFANLAKYEA